jgi:hypothetical protein
MEGGKSNVRKHRAARIEIVVSKILPAVMPWPGLMEAASKLGSSDTRKSAGMCLTSSLLGARRALIGAELQIGFDATPCNIATRSPMRIYLFVLGLSLLMPMCRYGFRNGGSEVLQWNLVGLRPKCVCPTTWTVGSSPQNNNLDISRTL